MVACLYFFCVRRISKNMQSSHFSVFMFILLSKLFEYAFDLNSQSDGCLQFLIISQVRYPSELFNDDSVNTFVRKMAGDGNSVYRIHHSSRSKRGYLHFHLQKTSARLISFYDCLTCVRIHSFAYLSS